VCVCACVHVCARVRVHACLYACVHACRHCVHALVCKSAASLNSLYLAAMRRAKGRLLATRNSAMSRLYNYIYKETR